MKLKLTRSQTTGMTGTVKFRLHTIVALDAAEREAITKYKLGKEVIYAKDKVDPHNAGNIVGALGRLVAAKAFNIRLTINDLTEGRTIECKEITEMIAVESQIRDACDVLMSVLETAAHFGGEEIVEL